MSDIESVLRCAVAEGLLGPGVDDMEHLDLGRKPFGLFYDRDRWEENLRIMRECFPGQQFLHACAVKTNPLEWFWRRLKDLGHGAECASVTEVIHSLRNGFEPSRIIFDSPCKTIAEIRFALSQGVHLNIDNLQELERVKNVMAMLGDSAAGGPVGIRINPLVGAGTIAAFSVSTAKSKFGVPCPKQGVEREAVLNAVLECPWICCIHVHTGSGGMGLEQLVSGVRSAVDLALEVNEKLGRKQIRVIDMGGGLAVDFKSENLFSQFEAYANALKSSVPELFDGSTFERVVTEFGAASFSKFAWLASRVEYIKSYDGGRIALIHAGSDIFLRACYCPKTFVEHRVAGFDSDGKLKSGTEVLPHDIAGPLCFAGDVVASDVKIPPLNVNDIVVIRDAGGNCLSIHTSHCSRQRPSVYVYSRKDDHTIVFENIQPLESIAAPLEQWVCPPQLPIQARVPNK